MENENTVENVIEEIFRVCQNAGLKNDKKQLMSMLIAYLRTDIDRKPEDLAINGVISLLIKNVLKEIEEDNITLHKKEIEILCDAFSVDKLADVIEDTK